MNNISIGLSTYPLRICVDGSLHTLNTNKQSNLSFNDPFLKPPNTISSKYNSAQFNIDSNGNVSLISSIP